MDPHAGKRFAFFADPVPLELYELGPVLMRRKLWG
jgi:hypothetical protein